MITDLRMDRMDGMALFDAIHQSRPSLPVIILTAHGSIPDAVAATRRGVFGYLTKPFDSKQLLEEVQAALKISAADTAGAAEQTSTAEILTRNPYSYRKCWRVRSWLPAMRVADRRGKRHRQGVVGAMRCTGPASVPVGLS